MLSRRDRSRFHRVIAGLAVILGAFAACGDERGPVPPTVDAGQLDAVAEGGDADPDSASPVDAGPDAVDADRSDGDATLQLHVPPPANVVGVAANGAVILSWDWPFPGPVSFATLANPGEIVTTTSSRRVIVRGLTNGTRYAFGVTASNSLGTSEPASPLVEVVPGTVAGAPDAPGDVTATPANGSAVVSWTAPAAYGSPVTSYTIMSIPDGITVTTTATNVEVSGLRNGTSYQFVVVATNAVGTGAVSAPSTAITPAGPPSPPTNLIATRGDTTATISWTVPRDNGSPITSYTVTPNPYRPPTVTTSPSATVTGLTNGTSYTFTVKAINGIGASGSSAPSNAVVPAGVPQPPTEVTASPRNGAAVIYWKAPDANGSAITSYNVTSTPGGLTVTTSDTAARLSGLTNGTSYTFRVTASNALGMGAASAASNAIVPSATGCAETSFVVTAEGMAYVFNGLGNNPPIAVCKGETFTFHLQNVSDQHPFYIRNADGSAAAGVTNNGATGTIDITWTVPLTQAPGSHYQCLIHPMMKNNFELQQ